MGNTLQLQAYYDPGAGVDWQEIASGEKVYFQAAGAFAYGSGGAIAVSAYNGGTHIIDAGNAELCDTAHPSNIAWDTDNTHYSKDGGASTLIDATHPASTECFRLYAEVDPNAEVTASGIFCYGATEADAPAGCNVVAVQPGVAAAWANIGGSAARLSLGTSGSAATHAKYVALAVTPTSNGDKTGTIKGDMTFV